MREIKFRAWDKINKKMYACGGFLSGQVILLYEDGNVCGKKDEDFVLMQFTGLCDKNGKEIYEGDILKYGNSIGYIMFSTGCYWLICEGNGFNPTEFVNCEIIGNIHKNPELINA